MSSPDKPAVLHHVGVVVPDLERAMAELTALLGLKWTAPQERPDGDRTLRVAFSLSTPRIELIQGNPGGTWTTDGGPRLDHMAFWIEDFEKASAAASALGVTTEAQGRAAWGGRWAYVRGGATGSRVELCDVSGRPHFLKQWGFDE